MAEVIGCETTLRRGGACGVSAVARCQECESAFCDGHQAKDFSSTGNLIRVYERWCESCKQAHVARTAQETLRLQQRPIGLSDEARQDRSIEFPGFPPETPATYLDVALGIASLFPERKRRFITGVGRRGKPNKWLEGWAVYQYSRQQESQQSAGFVVSHGWLFEERGSAWGIRWYGEDQTPPDKLLAFAITRGGDPDGQIREQDLDTIRSQLRVWQRQRAS